MRYQIWSEGYAATGERAPASFEGEVEANSFHEACILLLKDRLDKDSQGNCRMSVWGCRLFDNEAEARKSFG